MVLTLKDPIFCPCLNGSLLPHGVSCALENVRTKVFINNIPLVSVGDEYLCPDGSKSTVINGINKIFVNGNPIASIESLTSHGGVANVGLFEKKFVIKKIDF